MAVNITTLDRKVSGDASQDSSLATQEYFVNMGPQHPSTHGVLRLMLKLDGEIIREVVPVLGYVHRGLEKMGEAMTYRQFIHLTDRMDYFSAFANNWAVSMAVEKAAGIEVNDRIQYIRTIMAELQRIHSHAVWWGVFGMDLGAYTPFFHGFRDHEILTDIFEETTGARLTMNYIQPGGVMYDIHPDFVKKVKDYLVYFKKRLKEYEGLLSGNAIFQERLRGVGILSAKDAVSLGTTGPVLRASGVPYDLRKVAPYGVYDKLKFNIPIGVNGDSWDRYRVRMDEMSESISMVEQLIDNIPEGNHMMMKFAAKLRIPDGVSTYSELETNRGIMGVYIVSDGKETPYRIHLRTPNFNNVWLLTKLHDNFKLADVVTIISTLDVIIPDMDR